MLVSDLVNVSGTLVPLVLSSHSYSYVTNAILNNYLNKVKLSYFN